MRAAVVLAGIAALLSHAAVADVRHQAIPESLWGRWAPNAETCTGADRSLIVLSGKSYVSAEATCSVEWVTETAGARGSIYSAHMRCATSAGAAHDTISNLIILRNNTNQISVGPEFRSLKIYQRCSASAPATR